MVVFRQKWLGQNLYSAKSVIIRLYLGRICFIRAKVVALEQSACIWSKMVVFGKE